MWQDREPVLSARSLLRLDRPFEWTRVSDRCERRSAIDSDVLCSVICHAFTVENYAQALRYGTKNIYQTMPRMLTLWLDLGDHFNPE